MLAEAGFHLGLTGSVLFKGSSSKDLDLIVYPREYLGDPDANYHSAVKALKEAGGRRAVPYATVQRFWREKGSEDRKCVEQWDWDGKRVDVFFLT